MIIRKNGKVVRLTESDLRRITKRVISEQGMGDEKMMNPLQPITIELIKSEVRNQLLGYLRDYPRNVINQVVDMVSEKIMEDFHYKISYMTDDYEYLIQSALDRMDY